MILHFKIFVFIASLAFGVSNIIYSMHIYKKYAKSYLRDFIIFNVLISISCFWYMFQHYSSANIWNPTYSKIEILKVVFLMELIILILIISKIFLIQLIIKKISNIKSKKYIIITCIIFVFLMVPFFLTGIKKMEMHRGSFFLTNFYGIVYLIIGIIIISMFPFIKIKHSEEKKLFHIFKYTYLILFVFFSIIRAISFLTDFQIYHMLPFYFLILNLFTFLFLIKFLEPFIKKILEQKIKSIDFEKIFRDFNLTKREKEITILVCQGKSNKEIENVLFISLQTVKFHMYNIFQKTKVRNRIQLVNLIKK